MILTIFNWTWFRRFCTAPYGNAMCPFLYFIISVLTTLTILMSVPYDALAENGSELLMRQWAARKQQIKEHILSDLRQKGFKLPKTGHVFLEAVVKPNPYGQNKYYYELRRLEISNDDDLTFQTQTADNHIIYNSTNTSIRSRGVLLKGTIKLNIGPPEAYFKEETIRIGPMPNTDPDNTKNTSRRE